jgi:pentatricopeptide repeat protein
VFDAYACAGSLHLALATWDRLSAQGVDIGPIGSSALIKACARQMDLTTAKQVSLEWGGKGRGDGAGAEEGVSAIRRVHQPAVSRWAAIMSPRDKEARQKRLSYHCQTMVLLSCACVLCCICPCVLQVFEQLLRRRVTFNSYTYHCLMQLCGSAGSLEDALAVYNLQVNKNSALSNTRVELTATGLQGGGCSAFSCVYRCSGIHVMGCM